MNTQKIAVFGATGKTGARVLTHLQQLGYSPLARSRQSEIIFDWQDRTTWPAALEGMDSAYVTYYPDLAVPQAKEDMEVFVQLAKAKGVQHLVLLSGRGEEGAKQAEDVVRNSGMEWNIVRASWFMQNFSESFMADGLRDGHLVLPQHNAIEPFIDVEDIAAVAVAALTRPDLRNRLLEITGPALLSFADCVGSISQTTEREIGFQTVPTQAYISAAKADGLPEDIAWLIQELFDNVLDGRNQWTTDTVEKVLGRPAKSFQQYVEDTAPSGVWNAQENPLPAMAN
jgi:uncharacterized protein YbjT (DUF2867 family)